MSDGRGREAMICPVHGEAREARPEGLYCSHCDRMGRHGHVVIAACSNKKCGEVLLDIRHFISGFPAIKLGWRCTDETLRDGKDHALHVSAVWGDHTIHSDTEIVPGTVLDLFCLHCGAAFPTAAYCIECRAKMVKIPARHMHDGKDGAVEICSRRLCLQHRKVRPEERAAVAGLQFMCGGGRQIDEAVMRAVAAERGFGK